MNDFANLSPIIQPLLWQNLKNIEKIKDLHPNIRQALSNFDFTQHKPPNLMNVENESEQTTWLITLFNDLFHKQNVTLVHAKDLGKNEPEYLPAIQSNEHTHPAKICFAHGFFASALHEISHWTIAGSKRRLLNDFGYWYAPDGRNEQQQQSFEKVEIKPQAIECLLTLACHRSFKVSQDNLFANFDTSNSTFESDVFEMATKFLHQPSTLPKDAQTLLMVLYQLCAKI